MAATDALPVQLRDGLIAVIEGLQLKGDDPAYQVRVAYQMGPALVLDPSNMSFPAVIVVSGWKGSGPERLSIGRNRGDTESRYLSYPLGVFLCDRVGDRDHARDAQLWAWRKQLIVAIDLQRPLANVPGAWCEVDPEPVYDRDAKQFAYVKSAFVIWASAKEKR